MYQKMEKGEGRYSRSSSYPFCSAATVLRTGVFVLLREGWLGFEERSRQIEKERQREKVWGIGSGIKLGSYSSSRFRASSGEDRFSSSLLLSPYFWIHLLYRFEMRGRLEQDQNLIVSISDFFSSSPCHELPRSRTDSDSGVRWW